MKLIKLRTSDGDTRWVNLDLVRRVTLAEQSSGEPVLAVIFDDGATEADLRILGATEENRAAIHQLTAILDELSA